MTALRRVGAEPHADHAAHREAAPVGLLDAGGVHDGERVAAEHLHVVGAGGHAGLAVAAPVVAHEHGSAASAPPASDRPTYAAWCRASCRSISTGLLRVSLDFEMDRAAVRLDDGHCVSPNCFYDGCALLSSGRRASQMHRDIHGLPISTASAQAAAAFDRALIGLSEISRRPAGRGWPSCSRPTPSSASRIA